MFPGMEITLLALFPLAPRLKELNHTPLSSPASGTPNVPMGAEPRGFHISEHLEENLPEI